MPARTLSLRELNRALLARHQLLERRRTRPLDAVERLVGLQAQEPRDPYVALWTRLDGFRPEVLSTALEKRRAVRLTLFRGTLHLVSARDAYALRPLVQPVVERTYRGQAPFRRAVEGLDLGELVAFFRRLLEERPHTRAELVRAAAERWPDRDANSLGYAMYLAPTVQVTPRGLWGRTGRSTFTTIDAWLGTPAQPAAPIEELALRYLARFGPATAADMRAWCGIGELLPVFERLRPTLRTFRDERGRELFDVPRAPLPDADVPAPVRFLPEYDNVAIGHQDRSRIVGTGTWLWTEVGWGTVLVDGFTSARWKLERGKESATLRIEPFRPFRRAERTDVAREGERLAAFLASDARSRTIRLAPSR